jgi:LmbE family N-acetylglucosaminyl deacetylase
MKKLRVMAIGAHPDDCDFRFGGTAIKFKEAGHEVMFLSMTNGCSGHQTTPGAEMSARRFGEIQAVSRLTGIAYKMTDIPDGSLTSDLRTRDLLMREIRAFKPDMIITHRPNDYHPDHRNTGTLVMDCSYLVIVPHVTPDSPPLRQAPYIFHVYDNFTFPAPFVPQIVVSIDDVAAKKAAMLDCHSSQVYEWLPWAGGYLSKVPPASDPKGRLAWLKSYLRERDSGITERCRELLIECRGKEKGSAVRQCEAFQLCEYGRQDDLKKIRGLFPL